MDKFFCNPAYPILFNSAESFSNGGVNNCIFGETTNLKNAQETYDFFFNDGYDNQVKNKNKKQ